MGNYPRFFGKDASNLPYPPTHPAVAAMLREAEQLIADTRKEIDQVDTDFRFLLMMIAEYGQ